MEKQQKCYLQFAVPSIEEPIAISIDEEQKDYTLSQMIDQLAKTYEEANARGEAESIRQFKGQDLVIKGQALDLNTKISDLPFELTAVEEGRVFFAQIDVSTTHVMG